MLNCQLTANGTRPNDRIVIAGSCGIDDCRRGSAPNVDNVAGVVVKDYAGSRVGDRETFLGCSGREVIIARVEGSRAGGVKYECAKLS